jgi:homogentisate 1,2-dioxygenase
VTYYVKVGDVPKKRHYLYKSPAGERLAEELMGEEGFSGASSLLYHRHSPSAVSAIETFELKRSELTPNLPVRPMHLRTFNLDEGGDLVTGRHAIAASSTVTLCWAAADATSGLYRNAAGDELVFIHTGRAVLESVFGRIEAAAGDYLVIPQSTTHRWVIDEHDAPVRALVLEAKGHIGPPTRYLTAGGQLREGAPYSERDLRPPEGPLVVEGENVPVLIRTRSGWTRHVHEHHPFDVVGWDGCAYPFAFSIKDFEPIVGRIHQPPPVHQTFAGPGFVVCSFVPRLYDFDPQSVKVPYHHANVDSDEVLYYVEGDFMSRKGAGIAAGSITLHPAGFVHGPQPGSVEASMGETRTDETAVMVDTFEPLLVSEEARAVADPAYEKSWLERR